MKKYYGRWRKLLGNSVFQQKQSQDLFRKVSYQVSDSEEMFVLKSKRFTALLNGNGSTMLSAWSRRYLIQEKAYATL